MGKYVYFITGGVFLLNSHIYKHHKIDELCADRYKNRRIFTHTSAPEKVCLTSLEIPVAIFSHDVQ